MLPVMQSILGDCAGCRTQGRRETHVSAPAEECQGDIINTINILIGENMDFVLELLVSAE